MEPSRRVYGRYVTMYQLIYILGTLYICLTFSVSSCDAFRCLGCLKANLTCNGDSCTHDCRNVKECSSSPSTSYGHACLAAKYLDSSEVLLDCFPKQENLPHFCLLADGITCSCSTEMCNQQLFYATALTIPSRPEVFTKGYYNVSPSNDNSTRRNRSSNLEEPFDPLPDREEASTPRTPENKEPVFIAVILVVTIACVAIATSTIFFLLIKLRRQRADGMCTVTSNTDSTSLDIGTEYSDTKAVDGGTPPQSPNLYENSRLNLHLDEVIGRGRFGAVWRAELKTEDEKETTVAVKVFYEFDSTSWNVEKELFNDPALVLKHENIIRFIKAEVRQITYPQPQRQYWLISQYYPGGSLQDYLSENTVTWDEFCRMACSTAKGVAHLHADVIGEDPPMNKYPVAHRDLKSSNVLIKDDGSCVIADFGLALKLDPRASEQELANSGQVGTPRYMPPEALESKINLQNIESFKQIDVYSLSLIIWEIARRCTVLPDVPDYELPYTEQLHGCHPTIDEMRAIVAKRQERPVIPETWQGINGMSIVANTIIECWDEDPEARLTASCIATRFSQFHEWKDGEHLASPGDLHPTTII